MKDILWTTDPQTTAEALLLAVAGDPHADGLLVAVAEAHEAELEALAELAAPDGERNAMATMLTMAHRNARLLRQLITGRRETPPEAEPAAAPAKRRRRAA